MADAARRYFYFPGGAALALPDGPRSRDPRTLPRSEELLALACDALRPLLAQHGMREEPSEDAGSALQRNFRVTFADGWHALELQVWEQTAMLVMDAALMCSFAELNGLLARVKEQSLTQDVLDEPTSRFSQSSWLTGMGLVPRDRIMRSFLISRPSQVQHALRELLEGVQGKLLPLIAQGQTTAGVDRIYNTEPREASPFFDGYEFGTRNILAAHLAGNPRTLALCDEYLEGALRARSRSTVFPQALASPGKVIDYMLQEHGLPPKAQAALSISDRDAGVFLRSSPT